MIMEDKIEHLTDPQEIRNRVREIYKHNPFMEKYFHIHIDEIHCGSATVSLKTDPAIHTNHTGRIHGGVLAALADAVTGVTCAAVGASVVTVALTMNFIHTAAPGETIRVVSHIAHNGHTTIIIEADMIDCKGNLMAKILATMMILHRFPEIPRHWEG